MQIVLIRHTSVDVPAGMCYGQSDVPLRDSFPLEASLVKACLRPYEPFDAAFTSPLSRCSRLASYCGYADARRDDRLLEIDLGQWEGQNFAEIVDPRFEQWTADPYHVAATRGESFEDQLLRVSSFLEELSRTDFQRVAVFCHGGVMTCAQIYAGLFPVDEASKHLTPYGGIVQIEL
jgi:alpha-ribazole phosphatase